MSEADFMAYHKVLPNFSFGGHWFSKNRYGRVYVNGREYPFEISQKRIVYKPGSEGKDTYDPVDWDVLQKEYDYWKMRYSKMGYQRRRYLADMM